MAENVDTWMPAMELPSEAAQTPAQPAGDILAAQTLSDVVGVDRWMVMDCLPAGW